MAVVIRLLLFAGVLYSGYYAYQHPVILKKIYQNPQIQAAAQSANEKVKGVTTSKVFSTTTQKLLEAPAIMEIKQEVNTNLGVATASSLLNQDSLQKIADNLTNQVKQMPKNQAKEFIRQICEKILANIDSSY